MTRMAKGAAPAREFTKGSKMARKGPDEDQSRVLTDWSRIMNSTGRARGGVNLARINWHGTLYMTTDMRVRVTRPGLRGVRA